MTTRPLASALAAVALLAPALVAAQSRASVRLAAHRRATTPAAAPIADFTLERHRTRWKLGVTVGGRRFVFGLDTGGGITIISPEVAKAAGCTPWGRLTGFQMMGQRLDNQRCDDLAMDIEGHRFVAPTAALLPPEMVEKGDSALAGSLGLDAFEGRAITLDLAAGHLVVESPASLAARVRGMTPLPVRINREAGGRALTVFVAVPSAQGTVWMELDSGNGGTVLVSKPYAAAFGLDSAKAGPQSGDIEVLPGFRAQSEMTFAKDMIIDGNLGMPFLRHCVLTLDLAAGKAWIARTTH